MKKIFGLMLSFVLLFSLFSFVGCNENESKGDTQAGEVVIADFEKWAPDFQIMRPMNSFGVVSVNEDPQYVHGGEASAKLQPMGGYSVQKVPYVYFPLSSELFSFNYCDFSLVDYITFFIYNAQDEAAALDFGLVTTIVDINNTERASGGTFQLQPGWNEIVYYPDLTIINLSYDITDIQGIYLGFENAGVRDPEDAPVFYLDDVVMRRLDEPVEVENIIELDEGEICDFEKAYQQYIITYDCPNTKCIPDMSIVEAAEYGLTAPSGEKVLRIVTKPGDATEGSWPRFTIPEKIVRESGFMNIPSEEWSEYRFCFEVYAETQNRTFFPEFYSQGGSNWTATNVSARRGQWVTYSVDFTNFSEDVVSNPGFIKIAWAEYIDAGELVFYFDNFRVEKKS